MPKDTLRTEPTASFASPSRRAEPCESPDLQGFREGSAARSGALLGAALILLVRAYRYAVSPLLGPTCRFHPSCSEYAIEALQRYGAWRGGWLAMRRLLRCHPWHPGGYDPLP